MAGHSTAATSAPKTATSFTLPWPSALGAERLMTEIHKARPEPKRTIPENDSLPLCFEGPSEGGYA